MGERLGLERELALLRGDDPTAAERENRDRDERDRYERGASAPGVYAPGSFGPAGFASRGYAPVVREREVTTADVGGYFDSVERARTEAIKQFPSRKPLLDAVTLRMVIQRDRLFVRVEGDTSTYVYPTHLSNSTAGVYYVEWNARCNLSRIIALKTGQPTTRKEWSDPVLGGEQEVREQRCQRQGLVWVTQTIGAASAEPPDEFPLWNYPSLTSEEAKEVIQESPMRPLIAVGERRTSRKAPASPNGQKAPPSLTITGITGGIFESGKYESKPLNFTYWTHDGSHALVSRAYLCNDKDRKQCVDFYYLVPIGDIADFLRFWPLAAAGKSALGMVLLWQIAMEIGVYFIPVIGPIWGLIQTTRGVIDAYKNWDKMKGWEKALVGLDVLLTGVPGGKAVFKGVKGIRKVEEGTEALVKAGLPRTDARRLMVSSAVLQSEKKTLEAVEHLGETLRKGTALTVDEILQVEKAYNSLLKGIPAGERALQQAQMATRDLASAKEFFQDVTLAEVHLSGLRLLTPEILVTLRETAKTNSTLVKQVVASAGQSRDVAWGIIHLQTAVRPDHLTHIAASLGDDVMRQLGNGTIAISDDLARLAKRPKKLEDAYQTLMRGGTTTVSAGKKGTRVKIPGLASLLRDARPRTLPQDLAALEKNFAHTFLTEGQLRGLARLDKGLQQALAKGAARDADLHRILTTAAQWPEAAALLNDLGGRLLAAKSARLNVPAVLGRLDPGFVQLIAKSGARLPDDLVRQAAQQADSFEALKILLEGVGRGKARTPGIYDAVADAMKSHPDPIAALAGVHNRPHAGHVFSRWAVANPDRVKGIATVIALRTKDARDKVMDIYLGFPNDYETLFKTIGEIQDFAKPENLDKMIGNLATAAITKATPETAMGATLVLAYARKHLKAFNKDVAQVFERDLRRAGYKRVIDLVLGDVHVELKFWSHFEGRQVLAAEKEFAQDLLYAIANKDLGLKNTKWVFSNNMSGYRAQIVEMMENVVMKNPDVAAALAKQGMKNPSVLRDALRRATDPSTGWLVEFF